MNIPARITSTTAVISLVFGILCWMAIPFIGAIVAVVCGHLARGEIRRAPPGSMEGDGMAGVASILRDQSLVKRADDSNRFFEIELAPGADPQALLRRIVESGAAVQRFEMIQPSLHQIFLQKVGATGVEEGMSGHG